MPPIGNIMRVHFFWYIYVCTVHFLILYLAKGYGTSY